MTLIESFRIFNIGTQVPLLNRIRSVMAIFEFELIVSKCGDGLILRVRRSLDYALIEEQWRVKRHPVRSMMGQNAAKHINHILERFPNTSVKSEDLDLLKRMTGLDLHPQPALVKPLKEDAA